MNRRGYTHTHTRHQFTFFLIKCPVWEINYFAQGENALTAYMSSHCKATKTLSQEPKVKNSEAFQQVAATMLLLHNNNDGT